MADQGSGEKTEEPTDRKLDEGRKKGQVWKSRDLSAVLSFLAGLAVIKFLWPNVESELKKLFDFAFERLAHPRDAERSIVAVTYQALITLGLLTMPVVIGCALVGGFTDFMQTGGLFSLEPLLPKMDKLNPVQGLKNIFSKKQLVELVKSAAKILVGCYVVYTVLKDGAGLMALTARGGAEAILSATGEMLFRVGLRLGILYLAFSVFDVWWQRRAFREDMKMTKDEQKREFKETEGDPHIKGRRRELHQEILESIQMESVKDADVVVTNPDHVAVALRYDREKDLAPKVLAKGLDLRAEQIKARAKEAAVPMMRNVPLAHALYRIDVGGEIPEALYDAVAEVLNFVYALKAQEGGAAS